MNITLFQGDCVGLASQVKAESVALAYLDPPFNVGQDFRARLTEKQSRAPGKKAESGPVAYRDVFASTSAFIDFLENRLRVVRDLLAKDGTLWLHLDHRAIHEAKVLCDSIFGRERFRGEVIWVPGNGAKGRKQLGMTHQTLLIYSKGDSAIWNGADPLLREPYAATSQSMHFTHTDKDGRRYRERVIGKKAYRYYADEGRAIGSVWTDCPAMACNTPLRKETTGYPTQKPLKLLTRIIAASSRPGDTVLDPFCGSGTTLEAAHRSGRHAIGCDIGDISIAVTQARLKDAGATIRPMLLARSRKLSALLKQAAT